MGLKIMISNVSSVMIMRGAMNYCAGEWLDKAKLAVILS